MDRRAWDQYDLAAETKKADAQGLGVSQMTVSSACRGKNVSRRTARLIAAAFAANEPVLDGLLRRAS